MMCVLYLTYSLHNELILLDYWNNSQSTHLVDINSLLK